MYRNRFKVFFAIILVSFLVIFCRLFYIQIMEGGKYSGISNSKRIRTIDVDTLRGTIYDRNGLVLAIDKHSFELTVLYKKLFNTYLCLKTRVLPKQSEVKNFASANLRQVGSSPEADADATSGMAAQGRPRTFAKANLPQARLPRTRQIITRRSCKECHLDNTLWVDKVSKLLEIPFSDVIEESVKVVERVQRVKRDVEKRNKKKIRILEETIPHSIASKIPWEKIAKLEVNMLSLPGVQVDTKPVRWYPQRDLASHIIGYVGNLDEKELLDYNFKKRWFDSLEDDKSESEFFVYKALSPDTLVGKSGIEKAYNSRLMGIPGERFEEVTLDTFEVNKLMLERTPIPGNNIFLTIDTRIQSVAEKVLGKRRGSVLVMNPWNGDILAMATYPRYNLNTFRDHYSAISKDPHKPFLNRPIQSVLPPGSVFKIVTAIAALEENKMNKETHFACYGSLKTGGRTFRCFSKYGHGLLNVEEAIQYSCNIFFFKVTKNLGGFLLQEWGNKLGLGNITGMNLPFEKSGNIPKSRSMFETMNLSIGQGSMLVTPIQITKLIAMIANGGWSVKPHILKEIMDYKGNLLVSNKTKLTERINISEETMDIIKRSLRKVVTDGTARGLGLDELLVAGKTGTTETAREDDNHAWFVGYAPFENPKYCFTVVIEHTPGHGGDIAGPIVQKLLSELEV